MSDSDKTIDYLSTLLQDTREELSHADSKAALLLAAAGVVVGALLGGMLSGNWTPLQISSKVQWLWWMGVAAAAGGIGSIAAAVYPRIKRHGPVHPAAPTYYGDVARYESVEEFNKAVRDVTGPDFITRLADQTFQVSHIVQQKYMLVRRGLLLLLFASVACAAALFLNIALRK